MILFFVFLKQQEVISPLDNVRTERKIKRFLEHTGIFGEIGLQVFKGMDPFIGTDTAGSPSTQYPPYALVFGVKDAFEANHNNSFSSPEWKDHLEKNLELVLDMEVMIII